MTDKILEALEIGLASLEGNLIWLKAKSEISEKIEDIDLVKEAIELYKSQPANKLWVAWDGGCMPVDEDIVVEYEMAGGGVCKAQSGCLEWVHMGNEWDIVAYRVISSGE